MELTDIYKKHCSLLSPIPTGLSPSLPLFPDIKALIFDIYGTLFISGCGDISISGAAQREEVLRSLLADHFNIETQESDSLTEAMICRITEEHTRAKQAGIESPEVEIREIWQDVLHTYQLNKSQIAELATHYEATVNPTWPMPNLESMLNQLTKRQLKLGIVSNAQFYTPYLFNTFLERTPEEIGFDPDLSFYSYQHLQAKPGIVLYQKLKENLLQQGILPAQTLYIGNDMRNDISPAHSQGFNTALFAGDMRSLRGRTGENLPAPDAVVTDLIQLLDLF